MGIEKIGKEIEELKKERKTLEGRLFFLKVDGAVIVPSFFLLLSLSSSLTGVYLYPSEYSIPSIAISIFFLVCGFIIILKVLKTIEWTASRIPSPSFKVTFLPYLLIRKIKVNELTDICFGIENTGEVLAEDIDVSIFFQPELIVEKSRGYSILKQPSGTQYEAYTTAEYRLDRIYPNVCTTSPTIRVKATRTHKYPIPIRIRERNVGLSEHKLLLEVVE